MAIIVHFHDKAGRRLELGSSLNQRGHAGFVGLDLDSLCVGWKRIALRISYFVLRVIKFVPGRSRENEDEGAEGVHAGIERVGRAKGTRADECKRRGGGKGGGGKGSDECSAAACKPVRAPKTRPARKSARAPRGSSSSSTDGAAAFTDRRIEARERGGSETGKGDSQNELGRRWGRRSSRAWSQRIARPGTVVGACRAAAACIEPEAAALVDGVGKGEEGARGRGRTQVGVVRARIARMRKRGGGGTRDRARGVGYKTTLEPG
ncbi:hypothetical protein B0H14DRAFT_2598790 [Mycena olivaceomarginata]|nr:hypothetical protein B0H14DRAFT_2598790 [Mycena olivaceomarginata]